MNKISLEDLPRNHLNLISITEVIWSCDFNQIPHLITTLMTEIQNGDITIPAITAIVDVISSKRMHQLRFFTEVLKQIFETFDFHLSPTYYFINKSLLEALVTLKIIKNSTIQLKSYRSIEDIYHIYPQNTINHCILWDNPDILQQFAQNTGFNINMRTSGGLSLIDLSAQFGSTKCFNFLVLNNAKITVRTLENAFFGNSKEIIHKCLDQFDLTQNCIEYAVRSHHNKTVKTLMSKYNFKYSWYSTLYSFNLKMFYPKLYSLENINSKDENGETALIAASRVGLVPIVRLLINKGANVSVPDSKLKTALSWSCEENLIEVAKLLIEAKSNLNSTDKYNWTPAHYAIIQNSHRILQMLVDKNAILSVHDRNGKTPLMVSSYNSAIECTKILLTKHINLEENDRNNWTALTIASANNSLNIVRALVESGSDIEHEDKWGNTPIMIAAGKNNTETVAYLASVGANVNHQNMSGKTALIFAADNNSIESAKVLVDFNADVEIEDINRDTVLSIAKRNGFKEIQALISE